MMTSFRCSCGGEIRAVSKTLDGVAIGIVDAVCESCHGSKNCSIISGPLLGPLPCGERGRCVVCKEEFIAEGYGQKICSRKDCQTSYRRQRDHATYRSRLSSRLPEEREVRCEICKRTFMTLDGERRTCGRRCTMVYRRMTPLLLKDSSVS